MICDTLSWHLSIHFEHVGTVGHMAPWHVPNMPLRYTWVFAGKHFLIFCRLTHSGSRISRSKLYWSLTIVAFDLERALQVWTLPCTPVSESPAFCGYKKNGVETSILWRVFCPHPALCYGNEAQLLLGPKGWQLKLLGVRPVRPRAETGFSKNIFSSNPPPLSSFTWWYVCTVNGETWRNFPVGSHVLIWTSATWLQPRSLSVSIDHHYPSGDVHKEVHEQRRHEIASQAQLSIGTCPCSSTSPNP